MKLRLAIAVMALALIALIAAGAAGAATKKRGKRAAPTPVACAPTGINTAVPGFPSTDAWRSPRRYKFPFYGWTSRGNNTVIWKKVPGRKTHYPAPNLPSCRIGLLGTEDRTSRKASRYFEDLRAIDGQSTYVLRDTFDRPVATIEWKDETPIARLPQRWGWYVDGKWAGHDASRAFEIQGNACKLRPQASTVVVNGAPTTVWQWVRDTNYVMIAFNPALGSPNRKYRPNKTTHLRVRAFIDRRALPGYMNYVANKYDFGCGASTLAPRLPTGVLGVPAFKSGYGPDAQYMIGQYFGEGATPVELLPGESKTHNNMPLSTYNPKTQYNGATYMMINTTGVSGGGMVRGIARAGVDRFTLLDEMTYCDPNYTLRGMLLKRNGRRVSKWSYFDLADFSRENKPTVRWVFGKIDPDRNTVPFEGQAASDNPASVGFYAWVPIACDR